MKWLEEIKKRLDASTPGEWLCYRGRVEVHADNLCLCIVDGENSQLQDSQGEPDHAANNANQIFIAHAHQDIPRLIKSLEIAVGTLQLISISGKDAAIPREVLIWNATKALAKIEAVEGE